MAHGIRGSCAVIFEERMLTEDGLVRLLLEVLAQRLREQSKNCNIMLLNSFSLKVDLVFQIPLDSGGELRRHLTILQEAAQ